MSPRPRCSAAGSTKSTRCRSNPHGAARATLCRRSPAAADRRPARGPRDARTPPSPRRLPHARTRRHPATRRGDRHPARDARATCLARSSCCGPRMWARPPFRTGHEDRGVGIAWIDRERRSRNRPVRRQHLLRERRLRRCDLHLRRRYGLRRAGLAFSDDSRAIHLLLTHLHMTTSRGSGLRPLSRTWTGGPHLGSAVHDAGSPDPADAVPVAAALPRPNQGFRCGRPAP